MSVTFIVGGGARMVLEGHCNCSLNEGFIQMMSRDIFSMKEER